MNILFLTHTDIKSDSRILKEMQSLTNYKEDYKLSGIGVKKNEGSQNTNDINKFNIYSIKLKTRQWIFLPVMLRHTCSLVELTFKMAYKSVRLKPNIIHCNDTLVLPLGVIVKIFTGAKLIYDAHELE